MGLHRKIVSTIDNFIYLPFGARFFCPIVSKNEFSRFSTAHCSAVESYSVPGDVSADQSGKPIDFETKHDADIIIAKVIRANDESEIFQYLVRDSGCNTIQITHSLLSRLLNRFHDDWKSALGVFRWVETHFGYKPSPELYDKLVEILGKMKQMEKMKALVEEMRKYAYLLFPDETT